MLNVCVVEDDDECRTQLCDFLRRYGRELGERIETASYTDGDDIVRQYRPGADIILFDIEMRFMNGMDAAREIRKVDDNVIIMFVTNAPQYAMKGYEVSAFDYILKPMTYGVFVQHFERALHTLSRRRGTTISLPMAGGMQCVRTDAIRYAEVRDHTLVLHTTGGSSPPAPPCVSWKQPSTRASSSVATRCISLIWTMWMASPAAMCISVMTR